MITRIKVYLAQRYQRRMHQDYLFFVNQSIETKRLANKSFLENQALAGRIKLLEEQQEIMHNFLIEINKYLVKLTDTDKMCDRHDAEENEKYLASDHHSKMVELLNKTEKQNGLRVNKTKAKGQKANERGNHQRKTNKTQRNASS